MEYVFNTFPGQTMVSMTIRLASFMPPTFFHVWLGAGGFSRADQSDNGLWADNTLETSPEVILQSNGKNI